MAGYEARDALTDLIMVPAEAYAAELSVRARRHRYEMKNPGRVHSPSRVPAASRPFVAWDGEGPRDAGYALFGSSMGDEICRPFLSTRSCLDLILSRELETPEAIHIWFGSNYDVSMILKDLPWRCLSGLKHWTRTLWEGYELEHIPRKWLKIRARGLTAKIFDIQSFFAGSYVNALIAMGVGTDEEIAHLRSEKARRSVFMFSEIDDIRRYWRLELRLMPALADNLRDRFSESGFSVSSWHGPGSLANLAMRKHGVAAAMSQTPEPVQVAARHAFAGGRFEMFRGGHITRRIYNADIRSAYPAYARNLPDLSKGCWRAGRTYEPGKFAVYRIRYRAAFSPHRPYPLFRRHRNGEVSWPHHTEGWYWGPEAELVADNPCAEFIHAWIFDEWDNTCRPFAWLGTYYNERQQLKRAGSPLELTYKLIINSVYGQLAQRTGWDKRNRLPPRSHQLEWAGYITSACRAAVYQAAVSCEENLLSIDTDGIYSMSPVLGLRYGAALGEWDADEFDGGVFFQSGIYSLKRDGEWIKGKTRGIPKGQYEAADLIECCQTGQPLTLSRNVFTGYGLALNGQRDRLNTWETRPVVITLGGTGKRYHNTERWCGRNGHCAGGVHEFIPRPVDFEPGGPVMSEPHYLPWLAADPRVELRKLEHQELVLFDANHLDEDMEWVREYA